MKNIKLLEKFYYLFLFVVFFLVVFTPYVIRTDFWFVEEEFFEMETIIFLFAVGYFILRLYQREVSKNLRELEKTKRENADLEERLTDAFKYIGSVNVRIGQIKTAFSDIKSFPETKKEFKHIIKFFSERILGIVNVECVMIRIVDARNFVSLQEYCEKRAGVHLAECKIHNRDLLKGEKFDDYDIIGSVQENLHIRSFCIMPKSDINKEQEILVRAMINYLQMLFLVLYVSNNKK